MKSAAHNPYCLLEGEIPLSKRTDGNRRGALNAWVATHGSQLVWMALLVGLAVLAAFLLR